MNTIKFLLIIAIFFNVSFCKHKSKSKNRTVAAKTKTPNFITKESTKTVPTTNYDTDEVINKAKKHIGTPYKSGGREPSGFDCSGFTCYIYGKFNITLPPTAALQSETGRSVLLNEAQKGDLVFFKGNDANSKNVGHVGIVVSSRGEPIKFIHSSTSKGITISGLEQKYYRERFIKIRRIK